MPLVGAWGGTKGGGGYDPAKGGMNTAGNNNRGGATAKDNGRSGGDTPSGTPPDPTHVNKTVLSVNNLSDANQNSSFNSSVQKNTGAYDHYINTAAGNSTTTSNQPPNPITPTNKD